MDIKTTGKIFLAIGLLCAGTSIFGGLLALWAARAPAPAEAPVEPVREQGACVDVPALPDGSLAPSEVLKVLYGASGDTWKSASFRFEDKDYHEDVAGLRVLGTLDVRSLRPRSRLVLTDGQLVESSYTHVLGAMLLHEEDGRWCVTASAPVIRVAWVQNWEIGDVIPLDTTRDGVVVKDLAPDGDIAEEGLIVVAWSPVGTWIVYQDESTVACDPEAGCVGYGADLVTRPGPDGTTEIYRRPWSLGEGGEQETGADERLVWKDERLQALSTSSPLPEVGTSDGPWELDAERAAALGVPAGTWTATWMRVSDEAQRSVIGLLRSTNPSTEDVLIGAAVLQRVGDGAAASWTPVSREPALFAVPGQGAPPDPIDLSPYAFADNEEMQSVGPGPWVPFWWRTGASQDRGGPERPHLDELRVRYIYAVDGRATVLVDALIARYDGPDGAPTLLSEVGPVDGGPVARELWPAIRVGTCAVDPTTSPPQVLHPVELTIHRPSSPPAEPERWTWPPSAEALPSVSGATCPAPEGALPSPSRCAVWEDSAGAHVALLSADEQPVMETPVGSGVVQDVQVRAEVWDLGGDAAVRSLSVEPQLIACQDSEVDSVEVTPAFRTDVDGDGVAEVTVGVQVGCQDTTERAFHVIVAEGGVWTWEKGRRSWSEGVRPPSAVPPPLATLAPTMAELLAIRCPDTRGE